MLRVSLIGAGDIKEHYFDMLKISKERFDKEIRDIANALVDFEIVLLPDGGISFEVAKKYKEFNGRKVYGTVPRSDKDFGIKHLKEYLGARVNGKKVFDEIIDTGDWYKQDLTCCVFGDIVLMLGNSLGSLGELVYGYYLYKLFMGKKVNIKTMKKKIHKEIRAGENIPFSVIVYMPFMKGKLNYEIEEYIKKLNCRVYYVNNVEEMKDVLMSSSIFN